MSERCERLPLCAVALATNLQLRARVAELQRELDARPVRTLRVGRANTAARRAAERERDEALAEVDAARLHVWQRLPWRGYAS